MPKTTVDLDHSLLESAKEILGTSTIKETIQAALTEVVRRKDRARAIDEIAEMVQSGELDMDALGSDAPESADLPHGDVTVGSSAFDLSYRRHRDTAPNLVVEVKGQGFADVSEKILATFESRSATYEHLYEAAGLLPRGFKREKKRKRASSNPSYHEMRNALALAMTVLAERRARTLLSEGVDLPPSAEGVVILPRWSTDLEAEDPHGSEGEGVEVGQGKSKGSTED